MTRRVALEAAWLIVLCTIVVLVVQDHTRGDSITIDEPLHIFAGAEYATLGTMFTNPEHPPLAKDLAAFALLRGALEPPRIQGVGPIPPADDLLNFFYRNRMPLAELLARARAPFRWLLAALVVVVYLAARHIWGAGAAIVASAVIALDPTFIAHAGVVHTDLPAALLMTLTVIMTIAAVGAKPARWIAAGLFLGLAISAKFTALFLVPLVLLAPLLLFLEGSPMRELVAQWAGALAACMIAALVVFMVYAVNLHAMDADQAGQAAATFLQTRQADPETVARLARLTTTSPPLGMFLTGVEGVRLTSKGGFPPVFLHGRVTQTGFPHYFFVAFLLKSSLAMLVLTAALFAGGRFLRSKWAIGLLVPVVTLFAVTVATAFNLGVRHILPVYPLLAIAGAGVLASRLPRRVFPGVAILLIASLSFSLWKSHPHELGYFNVLAGGSEGGAAWLSDSNIDWAQDIGRMQRTLRERGWERDTTVVVFSSIVHWPLLARYRGLEERGIPPGRYAVSVLMEQMGPQVFRQGGDEAAATQMERLIRALHERGRPVERIGSSITIYELR